MSLKEMTKLDQSANDIGAGKKSKYRFDLPQSKLPLSSLNKPDSQESIRNAKVVKILEDKILVEVAGNIQKASVAFSCLVQPREEDIVLIAQNNEKTNYILSIIERPDKQDLTIDLPGEATIQGNASLNLLAKDSVNLAANKKINSISKEEVHRTSDLIISSDNIVAKGKNLLSNITKVNFISKIANSMIERFTGKSKSYIRQSEELDEVKAGQMNRKVDGICSVKTNTTIMTSEESTIIDGKKIFTGL